jgi:intracellular sulfur oxidation DsrE/DsrF family protein
MKPHFPMGAACLLFLLLPFAAMADEAAPWGRATSTDIQYKPQKAVYDVAVSGAAAMNGVLNRASYLANVVYQADPFAASVVLVLHGDEISLFARKNHGRYKELMLRAQSLTVGGTLKFRVCRLAAEARGLKPEDLHGFVEVVPMADAEIVRLQNEEGYAYMR